MTLSRLREIAAFHIEQRNLHNEVRRLSTFTDERELCRARAFQHQNAADDLNQFADSLEATAVLIRGLQN